MPVEIEATVEFSFPVNGDFVIVFDSIDEMEGIVFAKIFNAEIVNTKCEGSLASIVDLVWE